MADVSRSAAELLIGKQLGEMYRAVSVSLRREAFLEQASQRPLSARIVERYAFIARRAARAEELDPEPKE